MFGAGRGMAGGWPPGCGVGMAGGCGRAAPGPGCICGGRGACGTPGGIGRCGPG